MDHYNKPISQTRLAHHGIKGQKWGVRKGPPYPLVFKDNSVSGKGTGRHQSLDKQSTEKTKSKDRYQDNRDGVIINRGCR